MVGIAVAAGILASAAGARPSLPITPADANQAITAMQAGLEPEAFLARPQSLARFSAKQSEGSGRNQVALAALVTVAALAVGHLGLPVQPWQGATRRVRRAWAQRAPPGFQHT